MKVKKITWMILSCALLLAIGPPLARSAEKDYPNRAIEVIINYPPGGSTDFITRILQPALQSVLGVPVILTNVAGGAGALGANAVAKARPDGYTIGSLTVSTSLASAPNFNPSIPYKYTDFASIGNYAVEPIILVTRADAPWKNLEDLVDQAKKNPGKLNYGSPGFGGASFIVMELIKMHYGIDIVPVHFSGVGPSNTAILGGHVQMGVTGLGAAVPLIKGGKMRGLVLTATKRVADFPDVPTATEKGFPEASLNVVSGFCAPGKTPKAIIDKLSAAVGKVMKDPAILSQIEKTGVLAEYQDSAAASKLIENYSQTVEKLVKKLGPQK